jgi:Mce-associated membrane protein
MATRSRLPVTTPRRHRKVAGRPPAGHGATARSHAVPALRATTRPSLPAPAEPPVPAQAEPPVPAQAERPPRQPRGLRAGVGAVVLLLVLATTCAAAAVALRAQAAHAAAAAAGNRALVDTETTTEVAGQIAKAIETVLSYDYTRLDANERAAGEVVTGRYRDEFAKTFADVRRSAPEQKLVLTTTVLLAGVTVLTGERAEVIATMDLAAVRDTTPYNSPGRVRVVATRVDGRWKIAEMTLL